MTTILFDMGGVLLDFQGHPGVPVGKLDWRGREALLRFFAARGAHLTEEDLERDFFSPWREQYERRAESGREADWNPHARRLRRLAGRGLRTPTTKILSIWFRPLAEQVAPLPGVAELLDQLGRRGHPMAIVSNVPLPGVLYEKLLARHDLRRFFQRVYFSYDQGHRKPSPAMVRSALADLSVTASDALLLGDRRSIDVAAGRLAGVRTVWLRTPDGGGPDADATIESPAELLDLI